MEKVTFGNGLPGYEIGDKSAPALIVIQVHRITGVPTSGITRLYIEAQGNSRFLLVLHLRRNGGE